MIRLLPILLLCACTSPVSEPKELDLASEWETLWEILDRRYGVGDSQCYYAYHDATTIYFDSAVSVSLACNGHIGCVRYSFTPDAPLGAYVIILRDDQPLGIVCRTALEELIHVADRCLAHDHDGWPFQFGGHPPELFDVGGDNDGLYPVQLELEAMALEECKNG